MTRQIGPQKNAIASQYLVAPTASEGYFTTFTEAIAAIGASIPATILFKPGSYTESFSLPAGISLQIVGSAYDLSPASLTGTITITGSGTVEINGLDLTAPVGADALVISGANATQVTISNSVLTGSVGGYCFNATNTNADSYLQLINCDVVRTGAAPFVFNSDGTLAFDGVRVTTDTSFTIQSATSLGHFVTTSSKFVKNSSLYSVIPPFVASVEFDLGGTSSAVGANVTFTNISLNVQNFVLLGTATLTGSTGGGFSTSSFLTANSANVTNNISSGGGISFYDTTFNSQATYALTGNSTRPLYIIECRSSKASPPGDFTAVDIIDPALAATVTSLGTQSPDSALRVQREAFDSATPIPAIAAHGAINFTTNLTNLGYINSFLDLWEDGSTTAGTFGMWGMNAVYNGSGWVRQGDGSSFNGAGYMRVERDGTLEWASFTSTSGAGTTSTSPTVAERLTSGQKQFQGIYGSYTGSQEVRYQATAQTLDATVTTLTSVTLNQGESITFSGTIVGAQSDHTNAIGGNYIATARRQSGGNITMVGTPVLNINSSSAATFTVNVDVGTQTIRLQVTGVAATTYNWSSFVTYQKILTNS